LSKFALCSEIILLIRNSMQNLDRILSIELPKNQSAFLWGPRKTGKTTFLKANFPQSIVYDFLQTDLFFNFSKKPSLLR